MDKRLELHSILVSLLGSSNVYYQPPSSILLQYPCIVYKRDSVDISYADDKGYNSKVRYSVTIIDLDPDSEIYTRVLALPLSSYNRHFVSENLNHDVITIYY